MNRKFLWIILLCMLVIPSVNGAYTQISTAKSGYDSVPYYGPHHLLGSVSFYWSGTGTVKLTASDSSLSGFTVDDGIIVQGNGELTFMYTCINPYNPASTPDITSICVPGSNTITIYDTNYGCGGAWGAPALWISADGGCLEQVWEWTDDNTKINTVQTFPGGPYPPGTYNIQGVGIISTIHTGQLLYMETGYDSYCKCYRSAVDIYVDGVSVGYVYTGGVTFTLTSTSDIGIRYYDPQPLDDWMYSPVIWTLTCDTSYNPIASFTTDTITGPAPLDVTFTDTSTEETSRSWNFGDGNYATDSPHTHTYNMPGTYTTILTATNSYGSSTASTTITVTDPEPDLDTINIIGYLTDAWFKEPDYNSRLNAFHVDIVGIDNAYSNTGILTGGIYPNEGYYAAYGITPGYFDEGVYHPYSFSITAYGGRSVDDHWFTYTTDPQYITTYSPGETYQRDFQMYPNLPDINIYGWVVDMYSGKMLPEATVNIESDVAVIKSRTTITSAATTSPESDGGFYMFDAVDPDITYTVTTTMDGYLDNVTEVTSGAVSPTNTEFVILMIPDETNTVTFNGTVYNGMTMNGIPSARVDLLQSGTWNNVTTVTDGDKVGNYSIRNIALGATADLYPSKEYYTWYYDKDGDGEPEVTEFVTIGPFAEKGASENNDIFLTPDYFDDVAFIGRVLDEDGYYHTPVTVTLTNDTPGIFIQVETDADDGTFFFDNLLPSSDKYVINASISGYLDNHTHATSGPINSIVNYNVWPIPEGGTRMYGYVKASFDDTLILAPSATVVLTNSTPGFSETNITTATGGNYYFDNMLPDSPYTISASYPGFTTSSRSVTSGSTNHITEENISLDSLYTGAIIYGISYDINFLTYVPSTFVQITNTSGYSASATSNATGYFLFDKLAPYSEYTIRASKPGYVYNATEFTTGAEHTATDGSMGMRLITKVGVQGNVTDITLPTTPVGANRLEDIVVHVTQSGYSYDTVSNSSGQYMTSGMDVGIPITVTVTDSRYTSYSFTFEPAYEIIYTLDIALFPVPLTGYYGYIYDDYTLTGISGASIQGSGGQTNTSLTNGFYQIDDVPLGQAFTLTTTKTGYSPNITHDTSNTTPYYKMIDIPMGGRNTTIIGQVYDPTVGIVNGATVACSNGQSNTTFLVSSTAGYWYQIENLSLSTPYTLTTTKSGYITNVTQITSNYSSVPLIQYIMIEPSLSFWGNVSDMNGTVIPDAHVNTTQTGVTQSTTTNESGLYSLTNYLKEKLISFNASKSGYFSDNRQYTLLYNESVNINFTIINNSWVTDGYAIGGILYGEYYNDLFEFYSPTLSGATISCWNDTWTGANTTTPNGLFLFERLAPNTTYHIYTSASGYSHNYTELSTLDESEYNDNTINAWTIITVDGTEVILNGFINQIDSFDENNLPVIVRSGSGVTVTASNVSTGLQRTATTNSSGGYRIEGLQKEVLTNITASNDGYVDYTLQQFTPPINSTYNFTLGMYRDFSTITSIYGIVYNIYGEGIGGAEVSEPGGNTNITTPEGIYEITGLSTNTAYNFTTTKSGYITNVTQITTNSTSYPKQEDIFLETELSFSGYVKNATSNIGLMGAHVNTTQWISDQSATTPASGLYNLSNYIKGQSISFEASNTGYFTSTLTIPPLSYNVTYTNINFSLQPNNIVTNGIAIAGMVYGITVDDYNNISIDVLPDATITCWNETPGWSNTTTTDTTGLFVIDNLIPNTTYYLNTTKSGYCNNYTALTSGYTLEITNFTYIVIDRSGVTVNGRVYIIDDDTVPYLSSGDTVKITQSGVTSQTTTSGVGWYSISGLAKEINMTVSAEKTGYVNSPIEVSLPYNGTWNITQYLGKQYVEPGSAVIYGQVYDWYNGTPINGALVEFSPYGGTPETNLTFSWGDVRGIFYFGGLSPSNPYTLTTSKTGYMVNVTTGTTPENLGQAFVGVPLRNSNITIYGYAYNAMNSTPLSGVVISSYQNGTWSNSTTNESGYYFTGDLLPNQYVDMYPSMSGYIPINKTVISDAGYYRQVDFQMIPINQTITNAGITGIVVDNLYYLPIPNATINVYDTQSTLIKSNVSGPMGNYMVDGLTPLTLYVYVANASGCYDTAGTFSTNAAGGSNILVKHIIMQRQVVNPSDTTKLNVSVFGTVYNTLTSEYIPFVNISLSQNGVTDIVRSDVNGYYYKDSGLITNTTISKNVSVTGYFPSDQQFIPYADYGYQWDTNLLPTTISHTGTAISGIAYMLPFYSTIINGNVTLSNTTGFSNTVSTNETGVYLFDNLLSSSNYTLTASRLVTSGMQNVTTYTAIVTSGTDGSLTNYNAYLDSIYDINFLVIDRTSQGYIAQTVYIVKNGISSYTTANGRFYTNATYGNYSFVFTSTGYMPYTWTYPIWYDVNTTIPMLLVTPNTGSGVFYPPVSAEIQFFDQYYRPLSGMYVTIIPMNTTTGGNWTILKSIYGISESGYYNPSAPMSGLTDASGLIIFPELTPVYYRITANRSSDGLSYSNYLQVTGDRRTIILNVGQPTIAPQVTVINESTSLNYDNTTTDFATFRVNYLDTSSSTLSLTTFIIDANNTVVDQHTYSSNANNITYTTAFIPVKSMAYKYGYTAVSTKYGVISENRSFTARNYVQPYHLSDEYKLWIAVVLMIVIGAIFSAYSVKFGAVVLPLTGFFFSAIGWISYGTAGVIILPVLIILGLASYIRKKESEVVGQ